MFNKFIRYYNQNRKKVITIIVFIIAIIFLIQIFNEIAKQQNKIENSKMENVNKNTISQSNEKSPNTIQTESIISDIPISSTTASKNQNIINNFIGYCNNGEISQAYNYLSSECKKELFETVDEFKTKYVDKIFLTKKQYNIENWLTSDIGYTYKITYVNDNILSTGEISETIQDYITIDENNKLNILRYIANVKINKTESNDVATICVIDKDIYDDYEIYNIKVTNNSINTIMLNRREDNGKIYVKYSGSNTKYTAFITDVYEQNLIIEKNQTKYISIKINKIYNGNTALKKIVFSDIINNKTQFDISSNKEDYTDTSYIEINM